MVTIVLLNVELILATASSGIAFPFFFVDKLLPPYR
jgi:hypothetical protein